MQASAQPSTGSATERQPDLLQGRPKRHGSSSVARRQPRGLLGECALWTAAIATHEASNQEMDQEWVTDGFVYESARVAAVDTTGAPSAAWTRRHRCRATDLDVDNTIHVEHAVDAQTSQMRKQTNQTQPSTSGAVLRLARLRRRGLPEIS
jgi:hypothetical protein